jgi:hypothetical protein
VSESTASPVPATPARLLYEGEWKYTGYHNNTSVCHRRLFAPVEADRPLIAIFTELDSNPGTSVTNRIEHLATMVWQWQERPEHGLTVIEHYPNRGMHNPIKNRWQFPEEFDIVTFEQFDGCRFVRPKWRRVSRQTVEEMIGQCLPP